MNNGLFRSAVLESASDKLQGDVLLRVNTITRVMTYLIVVLIISIGGLVSQTSFARTETVKGVLVPIGGVSKVYAVRPGVISAIMVQEGQFVRKGDKLATVSIENQNSIGQFTTVESSKSIDNQKSIAEDQIKNLENKSEKEFLRLEATIMGLRSQKHQVDEQLSIQKDLIKSASETFNQLDSIVKKGFVSKLEFERRKQLALQARQEAIRLEQQLSNLDSEIYRTKYELDALKIDYTNQKDSAQSAIETLKVQKSRMQSESGYSIESPITGLVTSIQIRQGQTAEGSIPLMVIVPRYKTLQVNLFVPTRAAGFISQGQEVKLLYDAFPYQQFGSFSSIIKNVSHTALSSSEIDSPFKIDEPVFRVTALPKSQFVYAYGKKVSLQPGMTLIGTIVLERHTFAQWIFSPIKAIQNRK